MGKSLGIMQGRLLPRYHNRYQAFPLGYWEAEFHIAAAMGFARIEVILDHNDFEDNPMMHADGLARINGLQSETGVGVKSVCADYFMEAPFHSEHQHTSEMVLNRLLDNASQIGVTDIIIPCVDQSALKSEADQDQLVKSLTRCLPVAKNNKICLNLETDLGPVPFAQLIGRLNSPFIKVNYDSGNSAALGYDPREEFAAYGAHISVLHIKDRVRGGGSVFLGTGDSDLDYVFSALGKGINPSMITLQASRQLEYVADLTHVALQKKYVEERMMG